METRSNPFATLAALMLGTLFLFGVGFGVYTAISRGMLTLPPAQMTVNGTQPAQAAPATRPFAPAPAVRQYAVPQSAPASAPAQQPAQVAPATQPEQPAQAAPEQAVQVQREILSIQQVPVDQPEATPVEVRRVIITTTDQPGDETIVSDRGSKRKTGRP